jgi:hypothetical protein
VPAGGWPDAEQKFEVRRPTGIAGIDTRLGERRDSMRRLARFYYLSTKYFGRGDYVERWREAIPASTSRMRRACSPA